LERKKVKHQCLEKRKMLDYGKRSDDWRFKERERERERRIDGFDKESMQVGAKRQNIQEK
jgi:hypothetical protein